MSWGIALNALLILTVIFSIGAFRQRRFIDEQHLLRGYLLAGNTLQKYRVINLLWSTSFSLNGMLYQVWLGYIVGMWGLLPQAVWAASFFWLAKYAQTVRENDSLHGALGKSFQSSTRVIAGLFSIIGAMALIGWEVNVGKTTFEGLLIGSGGLAPSQLALLLSLAIVFSCVIYTIIGGLRGNAIADSLQSILKMIGFCGLIVLFVLNVRGHSIGGWHSAFPSFATVVAQIGIFGLITNLAFSIVWQFIDMSAWQTVISGAKGRSEAESKSDLRWGGVWVFIAPGIVGTVLGILLKTASDVTADNVLARSLAVLPPLGPVVTLLLGLALISCILGMVDGLLVASGYALIVDIFEPGKTLDDLDATPQRAKSLMTRVRVAFFLLALVGSFGVTKFMALLGLSVFDILYLVIIPHLSLTGPVFASLVGRTAGKIPMWFAMFIAVSIGLIAVVGGTRLNYEWAVTGAGIFTITASVVCAFLFSKTNKSNLHMADHA